MPFVKGQVTNPKGRIKGSENKVTKDLRETAKLFVSNNIDKMQGWVDDVEKDNPERAFKMVLDMFEFSLPKLKAVDVTTNGKDLITQNIIVPDNETANAMKLLKNKLNESNDSI
jgi:hypothetical protein